MNYHERSQKAIEEIEATCQKYKVLVTGCGCCGSPYMLDADEDSSTYQTSSIDDLHFGGHPQHQGES